MAISGVFQLEAGVLLEVVFIRDFEIAVEEGFYGGIHSDSLRGFVAV